jgi:hypothetical protein
MSENYTDKESLELAMKWKNNPNADRILHHFLNENTLISTYMENQEQKQPLSFGAKLVGLTFNPSQDDKVGKVKQLFAEIADILEQENNSFAENGLTSLRQNLYNHAVGEILDAQMNTVKVLTFKY